MTTFFFPIEFWLELPKEGCSRDEREQTYKGELMRFGEENSLRVTIWWSLIQLEEYSVVNMLINFL